MESMTKSRLGQRILTCMSIPLLLVHVLASPAQCDLYECDGVWTTTQCDESATPAELPKISRGGATKPSVKAPVASQASSRAAMTNSNKQHRRLITVRPDPDMRWEREIINGRRWRFKGRITGYGDTKLSFIRVASNVDGGEGKRRVLYSKNYRLKPWGEESNIVFEVSVPAINQDWSWLLYAEYSDVRGWKGYHDLSGCCSNHGGLGYARCDYTGAVLCADGSVSPGCQCGP